MSEPAVLVRPALAEDADSVLVWRNDPVTRSMSRDTEPIAPETHARWWPRALADPHTILLIGLHAGEPVGALAFERRGDAWEASLHLRPESRGLRLAAPLLRAAIVHAFGSTPPRLLAEIRPDNAGSRRVFESLGFQEVGSAGEVLLYERAA